MHKYTSVCGAGVLVGVKGSIFRGEAMYFLRRKGFTFLEVMIVVLIIGVIAAAVMPKFIGVTDEAKIARIKTDLSTIGTAVELYHVKHGIYPKSISELIKDTNGEGSYLKAVPTAPDESATYELNSSTGEITCVFKNIEYSSYGSTNKK